MQGADNPAVTFKQVACPAAITAKSGCVRANDAINEAPTGPAAPSTYISGAAAATSAASSGGSGAAAPSSAPGSSDSGQAAQYAQCGGDGFTGPTVCVAPYTCTVSSEYYSQCL
jgi:Fungal cellulose binding domain